MNLLDDSLKYVRGVLFLGHLSVHLDVNHNSLKCKTFSMDKLIAIDSVLSIFFLELGKYFLFLK